MEQNMGQGFHFLEDKWRKHGQGFTLELSVAELPAGVYLVAVNSGGVFGGEGGEGIKK